MKRFLVILLSVLAWASPAVAQVNINAAQITSGTLSSARLPGRDDIIAAAATLLPAESSDRPTITIVDGEGTALSSPVVYRPYICNTGVAISNSDGQGDSNIRFGAGTYNTQNGANQDLGMYGSIKPGGDAQFARWPIFAEFITAAANTTVEVGFYSLITFQDTPLVEVGGRLVSDIAPRRSGTNGWKMTLTFPTASARRIKLHLSGSVGLTSIRVPTGQTITKPSGTIVRRIAFAGDSYCNGSGDGVGGGALDRETFAPRLARLLGADDVLLAGIGGTGFVAGGATNKYATRASYIVGKSPHILVVNGSINDGTSAGTIGTEAAAFFAATSAIPRVIVIGTMVAGYEANHDALKAATLAAGREFIDMKAFISGTGSILTPKGDGTGDFYRWSDGVHPTTEAHRAIARAVYRKLN